MLRFAVLVAALLSIVVWQETFRSNTESLETSYSLEDGVYGSRQGQYVYFYHFLDLYPIAALEDPRPAPTPEAARQALDERGREIELGNTFDRLSMPLYLPDIYLGGDPYAPRHNAASWLGFVFALCALYLAFWTARLEFFGLFVVALLGSDPFQLHEVYVRNNIFGWTITIGILIAAINLPLFINHRYFLKTRGFIATYIWLAPLASGVVLGAFRHVRTECISTFAATFVAYLFLSNVKWHRKGAMMLLLLVTFMSTNTAVNSYFNYLENRTVKIVRAAGGDVATDRGGVKVHLFWHSFWGGLGDFDDKYGYLFWDRVITDYGQPISEKLPGNETGTHVRYTEAYAKVLRDKVINDIVSDPLWLTRIILKRFERGLFENTPVRIAIGSASIDIPYVKPLLIPVGLVLLGFYLFRREWGIPILFLYPLSIGAITIAMTSDMGFHYYLILHLFFCALLAGLILEALLRLMDVVLRQDNSAMPPRNASTAT
ncbi:MAG: hypothetical protein RH946_05440 [Rhodospirillales bacterium]